MITITLDLGNKKEISEIAEFLRMFSGVQKSTVNEIEDWAPVAEEHDCASCGEKVIDEDSVCEICDDVPAPPIAPPPPPPNGIEIDADGLPWDGRIHATSHAKIATGQWRKRRGITDDLVRKVEAELRITWGTRQAVPPPPPPPVPEPVIPVAPPPPIATTGDLFVTLMKGVTKGFADKSITQEMILNAIKPHGVPSLPALVLRQELIPAVANALGIPL